MHIANIMFSRIAGGIEQAFVDYCEGLKNRGHRVTAFIHPRAAVRRQLEALSVETITMRNLGEYDPIAIYRLRRRLRKLAPDVAITHTHRSFSLARRAIKNSNPLGEFAALRRMEGAPEHRTASVHKVHADSSTGATRQTVSAVELNRGICPLVGVTHNYHARVRRLKRADAVITITQDLVNFVETLGVPKDRIYRIPNMVRCHELPRRGEPNRPPVIGTLGRMVGKKGFNVYIDALKLLKDRGHKFKAILGGKGEEEKSLKRRAADAGLEGILSFPGWIRDKTSFYNHIDLFCLPSLHEPFGIVLLEAFTHGVPVVATDSEGPRDVITPGSDALLVKTGDASALADGIAKLLDKPNLAGDLAANAFAKAKTHYSIESVAAQIEEALTAIVSRRQPGNRP